VDAERLGSKSFARVSAGAEQISRSLCAYRSRRLGQEALRHRMREVAQARPRYGYRRVHVLLRREGWQMNMKRVRRLYRLEGLQLRQRVRRRKHASLHRGIPPAASRAHERWSMDFVHGVVRRQSISRADGGRSMESLESDHGGGSKHVRTGSRQEPSSQIIGWHENRHAGQLFRQFRLYAIDPNVKTEIPASPSKKRIIVNGQTNYRCDKKTSEIGFRGKEHQKISDP
jgi:hypothetical protein